MNDLHYDPLSSDFDAPLRYVVGVVVATCLLGAVSLACYMLPVWLPVWVAGVLSMFGVVAAMFLAGEFACSFCGPQLPNRSGLMIALPMFIFAALALPGTLPMHSGTVSLFCLCLVGIVWGARRVIMREDRERLLAAIPPQ